MPVRKDAEHVAAQVRELREKGESFDSIAKKLRVSKPTAMKAARGEWPTKPAPPQEKPEETEAKETGKETASEPVKDDHAREEGEELELREPPLKRKKNRSKKTASQGETGAKETGKKTGQETGSKPEVKWPERWIF